MRYISSFLLPLNFLSIKERGKISKIYNQYIEFNKRKMHLVANIPLYLVWYLLQEMIPVLIFILSTFLDDALSNFGLYEILLVDSTGMFKLKARLQKSVSS